jgi:hypothetical protein
MKKQTKRPLRLDRETIRELSQAKLQEVAGGNPTTTVLASHCQCTLLEC